MNRMACACHVAKEKNMTATMKLARPAATAIALIALMGIGAANAADVINEEPVPPAPMETPPVASWMGPYVGVTGGYGFAGRAKDTTFGNSMNTDGFVGGGFAGYNYDFGNNFVAGVEGDLGYSGVKGSNAGTEVKSGLDGSIRARLGYAVMPDVLLYGTAGGAGRKVSVTEGGVKDTNTALGWTAGVGADVKITQNIFGRAEYRYSDYGSDVYNTGGGARSVDTSDNKIMFGLGVSF
jgi:outer membrane immunogenic protein